MHSITTYNLERIQRRFPARLGFTFTVMHVKNAVLFRNPNAPDARDKLGLATALVLIAKDGKYITDCAVLVDKKLSSRKLILSLSFESTRMKYRKIRRFEAELSKEALLNNCKSSINKF